MSTQTKYQGLDHLFIFFREAEQINQRHQFLARYEADPREEIE